MVSDNGMTEKEAAGYLGVSPSFLAKRRVSGDGPHFIKYGGKRVVYLQSDLEAWRTARPRTVTVSRLHRPPPRTA